MMRGVGVRWRCPVHGPDDPDVVAFVCPPADKDMEFSKLMAWWEAQSLGHTEAVAMALTLPPEAFAHACNHPNQASKP
jgi:hypothetical protein